MIYLDYAATTPMSDNALTIYMKAAKNAFGNSSSLHDIGGMAARTLQASRKLITDMIGGNEKGLYFTSGGSEANILAVQSLLNGVDLKKNHIITTQIEHSSLYTFFKSLQIRGYEVSFLKPNEQGFISIDDVTSLLQPNTGLVSVQHGNSEIGVVQPIKEIGRLLKNRGVLFHSDCVQTFGKLPINVEEIHVDAISISSHKIYGPKGIGAAYINPSVFWQPVIPGTTHESGFRPGTVDVPGAAAFATAAKDISASMHTNIEHYLKLRKEFIDLLKPCKDRITLLNENNENTLPNILSLLVDGIEGQYMMLECNRFGFAISTGSACQVGMQAPSRSILALGYDEQKAKQYIRISLGTQTSSEEVQSFAKQLINIIENF
ncbi:IscS subfamily cysteine desulfurase [Metabacillus bambusae]|uniref:IscS subfamily cysteine desulfurase n=1 Tax=Metabacillus bambusae TaxID=2795218 RepID=A0ABS3N962_9BACI|nr:IscS subfamily cysteine desulfurase [Metabacillus bambusae]MBO1514782.1 IscS subfamily cysteine desulfurase [Metabacillus bambusae]